MGKTTKVIVCGMKGVGKTALLEQLIYGNVNVKTVRIKVMSEVKRETTYFYIIINFQNSRFNYQ